MSKIASLDVLKLTFNTNLSSYITTHDIKDSSGHKAKEWNHTDILTFFKNDPTYYKYLPLSTKVKNIMDFSSVVRAMALKAIKIGLEGVGAKFKFHQLSTFSYADGQEMTTITGIFATDSDFKQIIKETKIQDWPFYNSGQNGSEFLVPSPIVVPAMTVLERLEVDSKMPVKDVKDLAKDLTFKYSNDDAENLQLLKGYHTFYKFLPQFSKVTY